MRPAVSRRDALAGLAAVSVGLAGCSSPLLPSSSSSGVPPVSGDVPAAVTHPALVPPADRARLALLRLPPDSAAARAALGRLAEAVAAGQRRGAALSLGVASSALSRTGLAAPAGLKAMPGFPGDVLEPARTAPDLLLLAEAGTAGGAAAAVAAMLAAAPGITVSWQVAAGRQAAGAAAGRPLARNRFGFVEGQSNPAPSQAAPVALAAGPGPAWTAGGGYLALRVIRMAVAAWDHDPRARQEQVIGRHADGRWLDGTAATSPAPADERATPLDAHVRLANPPGQERIRLLRRSWSYRAGTAAGSPPDEGLLFCAYTGDLSRFETVQHRLAGEALARYTLAVGGGYFFVPRRDRAAGARSWAAELLDG